MDQANRAEARRALIRMLAEMLIDDVIKNPGTLDSEACAAMLNCSVEQVEELARRGELPGVKFGRGWLFVRTDLLDYLAQRARQEAEERRSGRASPTTIKPAKQKRRTPPVLLSGGEFSDVEHHAEKDEMINEVSYRWIKLTKHCEITGDTPDAVHARRRKHQWTEGVQCKLGPDGNLYINPEEWNKWVEGSSPCHGQT